MKRFLMAVAILIIGTASTVPAGAISKTQESTIEDHCDSIRDDLKKLQRADSRARVYLGGYYETILSKFVMPLNVRLVENNLSAANFVENQNKFADIRTAFTTDFITYQQELEELIAIDCKREPSKFYDKLQETRKKRKIVEQDTQKIRNLISEHIKLVDELKENL